MRRLAKFVLSGFIVLTGLAWGIIVYQLWLADADLRRSIASHTDPVPLPRRVQVGDLVFQMPPDLSYHLEHDTYGQENHVVQDVSAFQSALISINLKSQSQVAGVETTYGVASHPTGGLAIDIDLNPDQDARKNITCETMSYGRSDDHPRFFTRFVDQPNRSTDHFEGSSDVQTWYLITSRISPYVIARLRMSDNDLKGTTRAKIANRVERAIRSWIAPTFFSPVVPTCSGY